jgi:preprotein translocase subunit SecF
MRFIKPGININFLGKRRIAFTISVLMILTSIGSLVAHKGPKQGIDFVGGTLIQIQLASAVEVDAIKSGLYSFGIESASVQRFGESDSNEYLIRTDASGLTGEGFTQAITDTLASATGVDVQVRRVEMVGPQVGKDLREKALMALFFALLFITIYISGRFEFKWLISGVMAGALMVSVYSLSVFDVSIPVLIVAALIVSLVLFWFLQLRYAMGAIVALVHDVTITVGLFSIFDKEFTLPIIAALLTIIGYSLNDTIIVFDRIRENLRKYHKDTMEAIINKSVNETLSRTILTSITTLFVVVTLYVLGGGIIHDLAFALMVGVLVGTYSSIFVASPILLLWQGKRAQ